MTEKVGKAEYFSLFGIPLLSKMKSYETQKRDRQRNHEPQELTIGGL